MNNNEPVNVPLVERLRSVPLFAREVIECDLGSRNVPYGTMCHEAAETIEALTKHQGYSTELSILFANETKTLRVRAEQAEKLVADMHETAVGCRRGPDVSPIADIAALRARAERSERDLAAANSKLAYWRGVITDAAKREDAVESTSTRPPAVRPKLCDIPTVGRILVIGCTDMLKWYADKVGKEFRYFARDSYGFWVRTGDTFNTSNFVPYEDAEIVQEVKP